MHALTWSRYCETDVEKIIYEKEPHLVEYSRHLMIELAEQVAKALVYIHNEGITHLDIKPCVNRDLPFNAVP